jgi:AcrR family transcriptional regulator
MSEAGRVYTGRSAAERDADRRQRLLTAGRDLFGSEGYVATSVERLCSAANVSTRHFYLLFSNKEDCFLAVYDDVTGTSLASAVESLADTAGSPMRERVARAFLAYVQPFLADPGAARITFVESIVVGASSETHREVFRAALVSTVETESSAAVARGEIADRDFRLAALALIGAAGTIISDWARSTEAYSLADLEAELVTIALKLLTE